MNPNKKSISKLWFLIIIYIVLVYINSFINFKLDLTADKRFSLNKSSLEVIKSLESPISIEVFLTGTLPPNYAKLSSSCKELLFLLKQNNPSKINLKFIDIEQDFTSDSVKKIWYDSLYRIGANFDTYKHQTASQNITQVIVPVALVTYKNYQPVVIQLNSSRKIYKLVDIINDVEIEDKEATQNEAASLLENKFIQAIYALSRPTIPVFGIVVGNAEAEYNEVYDLIEKTKMYNQIAVIDLQKGFPDPKILKTLIILKPQLPFTDAEKYKLDQYVVHGGNIIWCIDNLYAELEGLRNPSGSYLAAPRNLGLDDLFFKYGIRINNNLVQDLNCAKLPLTVGVLDNGQPNIQRFPWPYYPLLFNYNRHPLSFNIDKVLSKFPSSIDTIKTPELKKSILLQTDSSSRILFSPSMVSLRSVSSEADLQRFNNHHIPIAVLVEGKFKSLYAYREDKTLNDSIHKITGMLFLPQAKLTSKQIFISDGDLFLNEVLNDGTMLSMGELNHDNYIFGNANFFTNILDYMGADIPIYESRNKTYILRLLDKNSIAKNRFFWQLVLIALPIIFYVLLNFCIVSWQKYKYGRRVDFV
ncbi:MAG: gliding motility-associated ABC transporter substrate-binding protein GldG [Alphaproteobacteria bacterium]|nr:gliding motility-associated ABC transporter substrate-binding protein GldG [Alphaproteobacteria bacterium]